MTPVTVTIDGPGRNALSTAMMEGLLRQLDAAGDRPVLLAGTPGIFSAGLDLREVAAHEGPAMARYLGLLDALIDRLFMHPAPVVAGITGHAIAGGAVLALCCDVRVASDDPAARIGLNEVARGLEFPAKIFKLARHRLPAHTVERVLLEAGLYDPTTAVALGLVDEVAGDPVAVARARLDVLAAHPPEVYAATKRSLREGVLAVSDAERAYAETTLLSRWTAPALKARIAAVLQRPR